MLQSMLPFSLGVTADQRGQHQQQVVELCGSQLSEVQASLKKKVEQCEATIAECEASKEEMSTQVAAKGEEINAKHDEVEIKKRELAETARAFQTAREAVDVAQTNCSSQEAEIAMTVMEKEQLSSIITDQLRPLADGSIDDATEVQDRIGRLIAALSSFKVDESMVLALPSVLAKAPASRAAFDAMVVSSLEEELRKRLSAAEARILDAEPTKTALAKAHEGAEAALEHAAEVQLSAAEAYTQIH